VNPRLRAGAAHLLVDSLEETVLSEEAEHHLRVLRVRPGDVVTVSDGRGSWAEATVRRGLVELSGPIRVEDPPPPARIMTAIPKGERCDWMVQKLTETGATTVTLVQTARSVVRWDDERAARQLSRLSRVARQAATQARRVWLPSIEGPLALAAVATAGMAGVVVADPDGAPLRTRPSAVLIGPEGGFEPAEVSGLPRVTLGALVMRVETAAVAAAVLLGALEA
jgi:16S rRNA (uracil1498-N3)-methyltransferase